MSYSINEQNLERQRLLARAIEPFTKRLLDTVALQPNSRCLDVGCGVGETTRLIAGYLGAGGECVGIDQDAALIEVARTGSSSAVPGAVPVRFQVAEASRLPFADGTFDFVFTRYLLVHLKQPLGLLREMIRVARKGGVVAAQEPDMLSQYCYPDSQAYRRLGDMFNALFADATVGRKLASLFREAGCRPSGTLGAIGVEAEGSTYKRLYRLTAEAIGPALIPAGVVTGVEFQSLLEDLVRVEQDDSTLCIGHPLIAVWAVT